MKKIIFLFSMIALSSYSFSQTGGFGFFDANIHMIDYNPIIMGISNNVVTTEPSPTISLGGSGYGFTSNWVYGGTGVGLLNTSPDKYTTFDGGYGLVDLGYLLLAKKGMVLFPCIGIGGYNNSLVISDLSGSSLPFDSLFNTSYIKEMNIYSKGTMLDGSLHFFIVTKGSTGLTLAVNAGYSYCLNQKTYTINKIKIDDAPDFNMTGLHLGLSIGFGSVKEKGD